MQKEEFKRNGRRRRRARFKSLYLQTPASPESCWQKKIPAYKSKMWMEQLEAAQNKRQNSWQQFQTTKGRAKKIGIFSGHKRESIFKSPDDPNGKVGVTGSGKGLTEFHSREKHLHRKGLREELLRLMIRQLRSHYSPFAPCFCCFSLGTMQGYILLLVLLGSLVEI